MIRPFAILLLACVSVSATADAQSRRDSVRKARRQAMRDTIEAKRDSMRSAGDSAAQARRRAAQIPVTPALLASAFRDPGARTLLERARAARLAQDSSLQSYTATTYERMSAGMKIGALGRDRLMFRTEHATRVQWERGKGAVVDVTGGRSALPIIAGMHHAVDDATDDVTDDMSSDLPIPYFPGRESLWIGSGLAKADISANELIHPLAVGSEAYYTYSTGDSLSFTLPGGKRVVVRELRVQPRAARWNVVVGSLWFDTTTGQLVRGVYRLAVPMDMLAVAKEADGEDVKDSIPRFVRPLITPMTASIDAITVDYGLFNGRFWLPRTQVAEGKARVGVMRIPFSIRQRFDYSAVNDDLNLPSVQLTVTDTASGVDAAAARRTARDSACTDTSGTRVSRQSRYENTLNVIVRVPCDREALAHSPTLPPSIYDSADTLFSDAEMNDLVSRVLSLGRQAGAAGMPPTVSYGLGYTRYNRVEGLSTAAEVDQTYGNGYTGRLLARLGMDLSPNGEVGLSRSNGRETYSVNVYRRLNSANDWDRNPFSLSASLSSLILGHDDGVYYRSWGGELVHEQSSGWLDSWRLFAEQEFDARRHTDFSLSGKLSGGYFPDNIDATNGTVVGLSLRKRGSLGENPLGVRLFSDVRAEGAAGTYDYARGMADVTVTTPVVGILDAALTLSGGTSGGSVPAQRLWYLGGATTVRGQDVGVAVGDAYWLTRLELGFGTVAARPVIFGDLGWAGDRHHWRDGVIPVSGAGVGASFLDGLLRIDLAKGIRPSGAVRASMYLDARF
jgi:hypothetical protein